jgi:hypothetical protein
MSHIVVSISDKIAARTFKHQILKTLRVEEKYLSPKVSDNSPRRILFP